MNYMFRKKLIIFVGILIGIFSATITNASSPIWGTYKVECPANSDTYIGISITREPVFIGKVQSIQSGTTNIVAQGEPNWTTNQFVYGTGSNDHYYLKFTSGELEGAWYDIKSNGTYFAEIEIGNSERAKISVNDSFEIIPHWTLATLFPNGGGFTKSTKISMGTGATYLYKYTKWNNGITYQIGTNRAAMDSFFYRERGTAIGWHNNAKSDASNEIIEPNTVLKVVQPDEACSIAVNGVIPMCATSFEVFTISDENTVNNQDIYIAAPSATDIKLSDLTSCLIDSNAFASSTGIVSAPVDTLFLYANEKVGKNLVADHICYYRNRNSTTKWLDSYKADANNVELKAFSVMKIRKKAGSEAVAFRCKYLPAYISK